MFYTENCISAFEASIRIRRRSGSNNECVKIIHVGTPISVLAYDCTQQAEWVIDGSQRAPSEKCAQKRKIEVVN